MVVGATEFQAACSALKLQEHSYINPAHISEVKSDKYSNRFDGGGLVVEVGKEGGCRRL